MLIAGITGKIGRILAKNLIDKKITNIIGLSRRHFASGQTMPAPEESAAAPPVPDLFGDAVAAMPSVPDPSGNVGIVRMIPYADRYRCVDAADVIVSATSGPHYTFLAEETASAIRQEKKRLFLDNERKRQESEKAERILEEKLEETVKSIRMSEFMEKNRQDFQNLAKQPFGKVFYRLRDELSGEELSALLLAVERVMRG